jgi:tetratricopeptide (TPR) repeat protein
VVEFTNPAAARLYFANSTCSSRDRLTVAERGFSLRYADPAAMLAWCEAATVNIPLTLPASEAGLLLAHLGNAHRVSCNFREAEIYLRQALAAAPNDPLILEMYAALKKDKRQFHKASSFLSLAASQRRAAGDNPGLAKTLMNFALVLCEAGLPDRAGDSLLGALEIIPSLPETEERERLARAGFLNLAKSWVDAGKAQEALWLIRLCKDRLLLGGEVFGLRIDWLLADIAGSLGDVDNAVATYEEVRWRFAALGHTQEVAVVTLDLARLLLKLRPHQAREEALAVGPILDSLSIAPDARERKLLATVVESGSEAALIELSAALRSRELARPTGALPSVPGGI